MDTGEDITSAKSCKSTVSTQETPTASSQLDWSTYMQAYYGTGAASPPLFIPPVASSSTPHSYLWGNQGVLTIPEAEGKIFRENDLDTMQKCKRSSENSGFGGGRSGESGNAASGYIYNGASQSAVIGRKDSSNASKDKTSQEFSATKKQSYDNQLLADGADAQNNGSAQDPNAIPVLVLEDPLVSKPKVNLKLEMSLKGSSTGAMPLEDDQELKKQRRKESNKESARRSRLRKQQECEKLEAAMEALRTEHSMLKDELIRLSEECMTQTDENNSLMEGLIQIYGPDAISSLEAKNPDRVFQSVSGESNSSHKQKASNENNLSPNQIRDNSTL